MLAPPIPTGRAKGAHIAGTAGIGQREVVENRPGTVTVPVGARQS